MKKQLQFTLFIAFFSCTLTWAQPVLTVQSQNPASGERYDVKFSQIDNFVPGPGGANQTWDLSAIDINPVDIHFSILSLADAPCPADFSSADHVWFLEEFEAYNYYDVDGDQISLMGGVGGSPGDILFKQTFSDIEEGWQFPATFNTSYTYSSAFIQDFFGTSLTGTRTGSVEFDGYGTLITPYGTYTNVLRMIVQTTTNIIFPVNETQYAWVVPGQYIPLAVYTENDDPDDDPSIYFSNRAMSSLSSLDTYEDRITLHQNPVVDVLGFDFEEETSDPETVTIYNGAGVQIASYPFTRAVDVTPFPAGTYYAVIAGPGQRKVLPFVKS